MVLAKKTIIEKYFWMEFWVFAWDLNEIITILKNIQLNIGYEFMHMSDPEERIGSEIGLKEKKRNASRTEKKLF